MKYKAAETGSLLPWALALLRERGDGVHCQHELLVAGAALERWLDITRTSGPVLTPALCQELRDCCQRCLVNSSRAAVHPVPKTHFFGHLSMEARRMGNPKLYSCFLDESLNQVLRSIAESSHRAHQEERIFTHFALLGSMGWSPFLYGD